MSEMLPVILLGITTTLAILLYIREYNLRKKLQAQEDQVLTEFRQKGLDLLHDSMKKSQDILGSAELEGVKVLADTKVLSSRLEDQINAQLSEMIKQAEGSVNATSTNLVQFMSNQQSKTQEFESSQQKILEQRINQLFEQFENRLSDFLIATEQKTTSAIELELRSARQLIETYKTQQLSLIDENILAMMEQTLSLVLNKKLSLKEQLDLIYEALEKAKAEKFIV